jgi:hypothetical protein
MAPSAGTYEHTLFQTLVDQLAFELNDTTKTFFLEPELILSLYESFRVWNSITGYHREVAHFSTEPNVAFYHLPTVLPSQLSLSVTVNDVLGTIQYRLMEPYEPIASAGVSEMFSHSAFLSAIQQRHNRFLAETSQEFSQLDPIFVSAGTGEVELDDTVVSISRAVWRTQDNRYYTLTSPTDEGATTSQLPSWRQSPASHPTTYSIASLPNLHLQLIPPPIENGELLLFATTTGNNLDTTVSPNGTTLSVMDDSSWGVTWGAMIDLLLHGDSLTRDPSRAAYCQQMYKLSVELANSLPTVLHVLINDKMIVPSSLRMLDKMKSGWEGRNADQPTSPAIMGNWLALSPVPDDIYDIGVYVVRKAPLPALTDFIQYGREQLSAICGWAKQLLLFKKQGAQLAQGIQSGSLLIEQARIYNEERFLRSTYLSEIFGQSSGDEPTPWTPPRLASSQSTPGGSDGTDSADSTIPKRSRATSSVRGRSLKRLGGR